MPTRFRAKGSLQFPKTRVVQKLPPPSRNYGPALQRARALYPKQFIDVMKSIGFDNDTVFLARLRSLLLAIAAGHSFAETWDEVANDERLTETEVEALAVQAVEMLERDLQLEGLLDAAW